MATYLREKGRLWKDPQSHVSCRLCISAMPHPYLQSSLTSSSITSSCFSHFRSPRGTGLCSFLNLPGIFPLGACSLDAHMTGTLLFFGLYSKCVFSCSLVSDSFMTPWTVAHQTPLSMGFPKQEHWVCCHFLLQGIFPTQGLNALPGGFFIIEPFGKPRDQTCLFYISCIGMCVLYH